jgi:hypothetical protein
MVIVSFIFVYFNRPLISVSGNEKANCRKEFEKLQKRLIQCLAVEGRSHTDDSPLSLPLCQNAEGQSRPAGFQRHDDVRDPNGSRMYSTTKKVVRPLTSVGKRTDGQNPVRHLFADTNGQHWTPFIAGPHRATPAGLKT